jgi:hypothetical protein
VPRVKSPTFVFTEPRLKKFKGMGAIVSSETSSSSNDIKIEDVTLTEADKAALRASWAVVEPVQKEVGVAFFVK